MKHAELGDVLLYEGELARVIGIGQGRTVVLEFPDAEPCPSCHTEKRVHLLEDSRLFQDGVQPVQTIGET